MTRRRFYAPRDAFRLDDQSVALSAEESQHLRDVLRLQPGDEVYVLDGEGHEYRSRIAAINRDATSLDLIEQVAPARAESPLNLRLAVSLLKGERFDLVVQKATELGVTRMVPFAAARTDVRIRDADEAKRKVRRWQRIALEAAKQCGRARLMMIEEPVAFSALAQQAEWDHDVRLMFAEGDGTSFAELAASRPVPANMIALVGPEGGWTAAEIAEARAQGWTILTLGGRTLRAETAAIVVASLLQHRFGDLV